MNEALRYRSCGEIDDDSKYDKIANFYLYKICDSIIELDVNEQFKKQKKKIKEENNQKIYKMRRKK